MPAGVYNGTYKNRLPGAGMRFSFAPLAVGLNAGDSRRTEVVFSPLHHDMYLR